MAVTVALLFPELTVVVNHTASETTVQATFEVSVVVKLPAAEVRDCVVGVTDKVGAAWFTVTVRVNPPPVKVRIPVLAASVLAV